MLGQRRHRRRSRRGELQEEGAETPPGKLGLPLNTAVGAPLRDRLIALVAAIAADKLR
ncbi:MAG: hypothetical protein JHC22_01440, partial [Thermoproteus sp.]|nr:hypothetical protein [Thermoproteus sp.]